ncbi:MAG: gas vesicle protein GvpN [Bacteroidota bacterium]
MDVLDPEAPTAVAAAAPGAIHVQPRPDFVETPTVQALTERSLTYLWAGFPIHFRGPAGTGKTTLALHVAAHIGRPVMFMTGDEELSSADLIGSESGYRFKRVVDRFIHTVTKYEEDATQRWVDQRLTIACRQGYTLVYDEFTRSRPEANNPLLTVLEERVLILPKTNREEAYIRVHPEFRAIFTSNPEEYAGVHRSQDALCDRMVTIDLDFSDPDTERSITVSRSGITADRAERIVQLVRAFRDQGTPMQLPTLRACIMIARVAHMQQIEPASTDERFVQLCYDVLASKTTSTMVSVPERQKVYDQLHRLIHLHCDAQTAPSSL